MIHRTFILRDKPYFDGLFAFLKANWESMAAQGKYLAVIVMEHKSRRSTDQNKRYWAILNEIAEMAWIDGKQFSPEAWHEFFRRKFIGCEELPGGQTCGISTTTLNVHEFTEYMNKIEAYAASELGIYE